MNIPFNKEWILLEKEDYAHYLYVAHVWEGYTTTPKKWGFIPGSFLSAEYINFACHLFTPKDVFEEANRIHFNLLFSKPKLWDNLYRLNMATSNKLFLLAKKIKRQSSEKLTNKELLILIDSFQLAQAEVHMPRGPVWMLETPNNIITAYLLDYLEKKQPSRGRIKFNEAFQILTTSFKKTIWRKEREDLARIGLLKKIGERHERLSAHAKKYEWLEYGLQGKILEIAYFRNELEQMNNCRVFLSRHEDKIKEVKDKKKKISQTYKLDKIHQKIFQVMSDSLFVRAYGKDSQFFGYYAIENLLREIGRRSNLTLEQIRFLAPVDFKEILLRKKDFSEITRERQKYSLHISDHGRTVYYVGDEAKKIRKKLNILNPEIKVERTNIIKGQPSYKGKVTGRIKIVNIIQEIQKIHAGNILVSHMTNPDIVPAMKQAAAIITDMGGITCHAAIVSRELKKPCIIGTKIATKILKDGDMVEVDADKGIIKILNCPN